MSQHQDRRKPGWGAITLRVVGALVGGYAFTWGFASLGITGLTAMGVDFHESATAVMLLAALVYLGLLLWAFAAASLLRVWTVLAGGATAMTITAWALQRALLS